MPSKEVPEIVIGRLPIYLRALTYMAQAGQRITSSQELGETLGMSSAQIRKDLSHFGEFGKQGMGYEISYLRDQLRRITFNTRCVTCEIASPLPTPDSSSTNSSPPRRTTLSFSRTHASMRCAIVCNN